MKKLLLVIAILIITGCSGKYDLTITDDKKVNEKFIISVSNKEIENSNYTVDEYLDHYSHIYTSSSNFKTYNITTKKDSPNSHFIVESSYKTLDDYIESNSFKSMFSSAEIVDTGKYLTFTTSRNEYIQSLKNDMLISEDSKYDSFQINIKFYNEVVEHNADKVDKKNNIYTWYVDENENINDSYIHFKLGPKVKYFVKFKDFIKKNLVTLIVIGSFIVLIAISGLYLIYKNKKNNEI